MNEWLILIGIALFGIGAFVIKFGPYLFARWLGRALANSIMADVDRMAEELINGNTIFHARENHAAAEGIDYWFGSDKD